MLILEAMDKDGLFLDVGCANGYLIESLHQWLAGSGLAVEFYGLDISEGLLQLARSRLPHWQDRFFLGNALYWTPQVLYDFVYLCGLELVPVGRQQAFLRHLLDDYTAPGGRLILGPITEERGSRALEEQLTIWGCKPSGYCEKSHQNYEALARKLFWFDKK
jgi:SAM-dependent methyltransferase